MNDLSEHEETIDLVRSSLSTIRYHRPIPTPRHRHPMRAAAIATVVLVGTWQLAGNPSEAWAEAGRPPTEEESAVWIDRCAEEQVAYDPLNHQLPELVAAEVRGARASLVFADDAEYIVCIFRTGDETYTHEVHTSGTTEDLTQHVGPLRFMILGVSRPTGNGGHLWVTGVAEADVARVVIETAGLGSFDATVASEWFTVWWPTQTGEGFDVVAFDAAGTELAREHFD